MSCYFRHMADVFKEAGVSITKENKKEIDRTLHSVTGVEYKNCSAAWKGVKKMLETEEGRKTIVEKLHTLQL